MPDSYLDHLSSHEREKIRKKMRSPEAYEALRERVKGPENLEREMERSEKMAELHFALESEPHLAQHLKKHMEKDIAEQGIEAVLDKAVLPPALKKSLEQGRFILKVSSHPKTHEDALIVVPEGNVQEKIPVKTQQSERYIQQFLQSSKMNNSSSFNST
jgi:hypothetical protein